MHLTNRTIRRVRAARTIALALFLPLTPSACNDVLDVHVPGRVQEEALNDPALAPTLVASVIADFECAWNNYVAAAPLIIAEKKQNQGLSQLIKAPYIVRPYLLRPGVPLELWIRKDLLVEE